MARVDTLGHFLTDVADAIRTKKGTSGTIEASAFDSEIASIPTGSGTTYNWTSIGYSDLDSFNSGYTEAKSIYDNWDSTTTSMSFKYQDNTNLTIYPLVNTSNVTYFANAFRRCTNLIYVPLLNTTNTTNMTSMFNGCTNLKYVPQFDTSSITGTNLLTMFDGCQNLSIDSLNNILGMCINATNYTGTKTLAYLGLTSTNYPATTIQGLPNYQAFTTAGWTIGY